MTIQITRSDGSISEILNGTMRLQAQIQVFGKAEVTDPKTGQTFKVQQREDGSLIEAAASTPLVGGHSGVNTRRASRLLAGLIQRL